MSRAGHVGAEPSASVDFEVARLPLVLSAPEGYKRWAPTYDDAPNPLLAREERYLSPLLNDLRGKSVLDLACGTGRWLEKLILKGCASGVGLDISSAMLRVAGTKAEISGRLLQAECDELPLVTAAFDLAICSFALGHIRDLHALVCELGRVTKPTADVYISDLHPEAYQRGWRVGFRDRQAVQIEVQSRSCNEIIAAFTSNAFECAACLPLWLGEPEQPLFAHAGKSESFEDACQLPAVLVCHFRRVA